MVTRELRYYMKLFVVSIPNERKRKNMRIQMDFTKSFYIISAHVNAAFCDHVQV